MENEGKSMRRIWVLLTKVRQMPFVRALNSFMASPVGVAMIAALTVIVNATATEMVLYVFAVLYGIYLCILGDDFLTLTPLFLFCYIAPARVNNPGRNNASVFTGATGTAMIVMVAVLIVFVLARIAVDPRLGFKRLLLSKRALLRGMLVLGLAYALSGLFSAHYGAIWHKNVLFGLLQFATVFLLYFLFTVLVDWDKAPKYYFAWVGFFVGCTLALEVFFLYLQFGGEIITNGVVRERWNIYLGWGMHNNIGAMLAVTVPFAFCLAGRYRHGYLLLLAVVAMLAAICMTMSRTAIGAGLFAAVLSAILMILHYKKRKTKLIIMGVLLASVALAAPFLGGVLISKLSEALGNGLLNDSGRSALYRAGLDVFLNNPVFGEGFYPSDLSVFQSAYWFSGYDISGFLPPRWHNTVIQLLASCGAVGLAAYCYHRYQTVRVFLKGYSRQKLFIAISVACFLGMSLLDCHFFNLGPTMFYSLALTFAECTQEA